MGRPARRLTVDDEPCGVQRPAANEEPDEDEPVDVSSECVVAARDSR
jgi:hypothetical protein